MWYKINIQKLILLQIPTFLRGKVVLNALLLSISPSIERVYNLWSSKRLEDLYKVEHTGQVFSLRKSLNDRFDPEERRIEVIDGNRIIRQYIFTPVEQKPRFLSTPMHIYSRDDYADTGVDFVVFAPSSLSSTFQFEMPAHINFYKQDIKRFKIIAK